MVAGVRWFGGTVCVERMFWWVLLGEEEGAMGGVGIHPSVGGFE